MKFYYLNLRNAKERDIKGHPKRENESGVPINISISIVQI